jgi:SAM-dependent methyltransferase
MKRLNQDEIKKFYNDISDIWPESNLWYKYTRKVIQKFLIKHKFSEGTYVLNAGSAGNNYSLPYRFHHIDISEKKLKNIKNATITSVEDLPFQNQKFDNCLCVGSVLNYCDAVKAISELSRVLKRKGKLILEFESSHGFEYKNKEVYGTPANIISVSYMSAIHSQWLFSFEYIKKIILAHNMKILKVKTYNIISAWHLRKYGDENKAATYAKFDMILQWLPYFRNHGNNIIMLCEKL